jgi:hypothetical protein
VLVVVGCIGEVVEHLLFEESGEFLQFIRLFYVHFAFLHVLDDEPDFLSDFAVEELFGVEHSLHSKILKVL